MDTVLIVLGTLAVLAVLGFVLIAVSAAISTMWSH